MFSNILVPLDGSAESNAALPLARTIAQATGGVITLLRIVKEADVAEVRENLGRIAAELSESVPHVEARVSGAEAVAREILEHMRQQKTDLVIMRTHGRAGLGRAVLGSVTQDVLAASPVPVLLLRPGGRRIAHLRKLLVPVDGSPGGTLALGTAVQLSQVTGATLKLLEVCVPVPMWAYAGDPYAGASYYDPAWDDEVVASASAYVDGVVRRLRAVNLTVEGEARQGPAVPETIVAIADAAQTDLIIMSTRALTGPARALLGSTADAVVRTAHCPVLLMHRDDALPDALSNIEATSSIDPQLVPSA